MVGGGTVAVGSSIVEVGSGVLVGGKGVAVGSGKGGVLVGEKGVGGSAARHPARKVPAAPIKNALRVLLSDISSAFSASPALASSIPLTG